MSAELKYRMARLRQAEYLRQAEEARRANDALRAASAPPDRSRRFLSMERHRPVAVQPAASMWAHEPMGCDR
jgi:hypothetical protein